jgi:RNA polymerase sigma-54 factor
MTPQLQQSIKLLQLSNLELVDSVEDELRKNPLLELEDGAPPAEGAAAGAGESFDGEGDPYADPAFGAPAGRNSGGEFSDSIGGVEQTLSRPRTLREHLLEQLNTDIDEAADRVIGLHFIESLDEAGYIGAELDQIAERLGCDVARVEVTLETLQRFDPPGIFARHLRECLTLQLKDQGRFDPAMAALIEHLDLLAESAFDRLQKLCGVDAEDLAQMVAEIRALNPKPGLAFETEVTHAIVPDVAVRQQPGQVWLVELNSETLPRVLVNNSYYARVRMDAKSKEDRDYITNCYHTANWLVKALDQRARTILKVARELVRQPNAFLSHGVQHLKPLILRDIAEAIEMHESTVSRVIANKYMITPRGTYELKYFFSASIDSLDGGAAHSAESVRHRIKQLIQDEETESPLSDDRIAELLNESGIGIARRTVAKYRESMRIPSSVERRRIKRRAAKAEACASGSAA